MSVAQNIMKQLEDIVEVPNAFGSEELDIRDDEDFQEQARDALMSIGLTEDEADRELEDFIG